MNKSCSKCGGSFEPMQDESNCVFCLSPAVPTFPLSELLAGQHKNALREIAAKSVGWTKKSGKDLNCPCWVYDRKFNGFKRRLVAWNDDYGPSVILGDDQCLIEKQRFEEDYAVQRFWVLGDAVKESLPRYTESRDACQELLDSLAKLDEREDFAVALLDLLDVSSMYSDPETVLRIVSASPLLTLIAYCIAKNLIQTI